MGLLQVLKMSVSSGAGNAVTNYYFQGGTVYKDSTIATATGISVVTDFENDEPYQILMAISLTHNFFESNQTNVRTVDSHLEKKIVSPKNSARKGGLIINNSKYDLSIWFGSKLPASDDDWLVVPCHANCDIPVFFTGDIYGFWLGDDNSKAKIYEFYNN